MTQPTPTPNPATSTRPERSSQRVARKKPLAWLPLALLGGLALLLGLIFLGINAFDDDGPDGPAGDSLGQVGASDGSGVNGEDGDGAVGTLPSAGLPSAGLPSAGLPSAGLPSAGLPSAGLPSARVPSAGAPAGGVAGLAANALVGGAGVAAATDSSAGRTLTGERETGTAGTVLFPEASATVDSEGKKVIAQAASDLRSAGVRSVQVVGYTDKIAGENINDPLSQQRADAVAGALRSELPGVSVTTEARGAEEPVSTNDTEQGRQQNRRAAIVAQS